MKTRLACLLLVVCWVAGCTPRFNDHRQFQLEVGEISTFIIDGVARKRELRVTGNSTGGTIDVYVYLEENQDEAERLITLGKSGTLTIAGVENAAEVNLIASVPAEKNVIVMVRNSSREVADIDLKMTD